MKIIIDGSEDLISLKAGATGAGIVDQIEETLNRVRKVASSVSFNGEETSAEILEKRFAEKAPSGDDVLEIETIPLVEHLTVLLDAICANLEAMEEQIVDIADNYLKRDNSQSEKNLAEWCSDMGGLMGNLDSMRGLFSLDFQAIRVGKEPFNETIAKIQKLLTQMAEAMDRKDRTTIADLLEFEMTPLVRSLTEIFPKMKERVAEALKPR